MFMKYVCLMMVLVFRSLTHLNASNAQMPKTESGLRVVVLEHSEFLVLFVFVLSLGTNNNPFHCCVLIYGNN